MLRLLRWIFRPVVLIVVSVALVGTAALIAFRSDAGPLQPQRPALRGGEQEIAWIYPATGTTQWERFVAAVKRTRDQLESSYPGLRVDEQSTPAAASAGVPEVVLVRPHQGQTRRLVFRWYKLTSDWSTEAWVKELLTRAPYPLAIIGGNNSYWARELAMQMRLLAADLPAEQQPLLLLTTATAEKVPRPEWMPPPSLPPDAPPEEARRVELADIYPGRTYRFCFTNRQMATAITRFLWSRADLRPEADPPYMAQWTDDVYSQDLYDGYQTVLERRAADTFLEQWGFASGCVVLGQPPATLAGSFTPAFRHDPGAYPLKIDSGVGAFDSPNPYEVREVQNLLKPFAKGKAPLPRRLLVVAGQSEPSRRFLRLLARLAPDLVRYFVVATGDAISFNAIYRDRMVTWPIQDLPFTLALFSHRNPIDRKAGFRELGSKKRGRRSEAVAASGTEDLLLATDIVTAVFVAYAGTESGARDAAGLAAGLDALHLDGSRLVLEPRGRALFNPRRKGMRNGFTGEHVICLRPRFEGRRVLSEATIEVWTREPGEDSEQPAWKLVGKLGVSYDEYKAHRERSHGD
jgi:hypothetical protein